MMPANPGHPPPVELCDVKFRNNTIARSVDPKKYRWTINDPRFPIGTGGEIISWQPCKP
jgi:hypothetical protein